MDPREYDWQMGALADQGIYPDERGFQPTPTPPEKAWPVPTTGMAPWPYQPPAPAQSEAEVAQQARDAAAYQIRRPYQTAATRPPESNRLTAIAGAIGSAPQAIGNLAAIPGQTMEPNPYPPGSEEADFYERARKSNTYQKAPELAFNLMGSGTAFAQPGAAGMFGGKLSKTADLDAMRKAEEMVQYGKTASDIRKETNWFPTVGGILKYEIPDRGTNWVKGMEPSKILQSKLPASAEFGAAYRHPELFEAYPDLAKTPLVISNNLGRGTRGGFQPPDVEGELGKVFLASPASGKTMRDVALHEAGHVVQGIEDWPIGGSPFRPIKEGTPAWDIYQRIKKDATAPMSREEYAAMIRDVGITTAPPNAYEKYIAGYKYDLPKSKDDQLKRWAAAEAYRRSAGEVEARNIQTRKDYTKEQRRIISPEASQDIPYSEQIVERERRRPSLPEPDPGGAAPWEMSSLADQSRLQLSQEKPVGFAPGSVLTPTAEYANPRLRKKAEGLFGKYPQYAEQYPSVGPPELMAKPPDPNKPGAFLTKGGKPVPYASMEEALAKDAEPGFFLEKKLTPEAAQFQKDRAAIQEDMDLHGYKPYFDPAKRFDVDPKHYGPFDDTAIAAAPKTAKTEAEWYEKYGSPEARARLQQGFKEGKTVKDSADWYFMGQLEKEYIKELGAKEGRAAFKREFGDMMAATTGGQSPYNNFLMSQYANVMAKRGERMPGRSYELPFPVGGRYASGNIEQAQKYVDEGRVGFSSAQNPKRYDFSSAFQGNKNAFVIDEQMMNAIQPGVNIPQWYGPATRVGREEAAKLGGGDMRVQDVGWAGLKKAKEEARGKTFEYEGPMINHINRSIETTHRLTGMPRAEIVRRGLIRKEIPMYGLGGLTAMGGLAAQNDYRQ